MRLLLLAFGLQAALATSVASETLVATRTLRAQTLLTEGDLKLVPGTVPGSLTDPAEAVGWEARVTLYANRPIRPSDIGPPALVNRNEVVALIYRRGGLAIATEGRALERGGEGDMVRVMNLASRNSLTGRVLRDGTIEIN